MNNNLNNNVNTGVPVNNGGPTTVINSVPVNSVPNTVSVTQQVNPGVVNTPGSVVNGAVNVQNTVPGTNVNVVPNTVPTPPIVNAVNDIGQDGIATNTYVLVGTIVGIVIMAAVFLLVLLVTGVIGNRNKLNCTKTTNEEGYVYTENRVYRFNDGPYYTKIDKTLIFDFTMLTDEMYNEKFSALIDNDNAVSSYGFGTYIRREGNRVIINSYDPKIFDKTVNDVLVGANKDGFTCD